jgi:outer membrane protein OmpA-like peptidoglycan-associated protein
MKRAGSGRWVTLVLAAAGVGTAGAQQQPREPKVEVQVEHRGWEAWQRQAEAQARQLREANARAARAEQRLAGLKAEVEAREKLEEVATVTQDERGLVLTLTGSVLFAFDRADLLPEAARRLDAVAEALVAQPAGQEIIVEGHTDSRGTEPYNEALSLARAESVRTYLERRGVQSSRVRAEGFGEASPVATNATAEGRANNRRVEIVLPRLGVGGAGR